MTRQPERGQLVDELAFDARALPLRTTTAAHGTALILYPPPSLRIVRPNSASERFSCEIWTKMVCRHSGPPEGSSQTLARNSSAEIPGRRFTVSRIRCLIGVKSGTGGTIG